MTFPSLRGKHAHDALVTPHDALADLRSRGEMTDLTGVRGVILCYQNRLVDRVLADGTGTRVRGVPGDCVLLDAPDGARIGVCGRFGIGAPAVTVPFELLIALGIRRFVSIGTAGCLQRGTGIGDLVLCTEAIRDEGVSHHYLAADAPARPTPGLTERLRQALEATRDATTPLTAGPSWTIDAPYRETVEEARHYQALGVQTVEMEASALFAVAAYRGVEIASAFVVSDSLAELVWTPRFHDPAVDRGLDTLFAAARAALLMPE